MSKNIYNLIVVTFHSPDIATQALSLVDKLYLKNKIELSDYVYVSCIDDDELMLRQSIKLSIDKKKADNPLWQSLISLIYWSDSSSGIIKSGLKLLKNEIIQAGLSAPFLEKVSASTSTSSDAIFALIKSENFSDFTKELADLDAELFYTSLDNDSLTRISQALH